MILKLVRLAILISRIDIIGASTEVIWRNITAGSIDTQFTLSVPNKLRQHMNKCWEEELDLQLAQMLLLVLLVLFNFKNASICRSISMNLGFFGKGNQRIILLIRFAMWIIMRIETTPSTINLSCCDKFDVQVCIHTIL